MENETTEEENEEEVIGIREEVIENRQVDRSNFEVNEEINEEVFDI